MFIPTGIKCCSVDILDTNENIIWRSGETIPSTIFDSELEHMVDNPYIKICDYEVHRDLDTGELKLVKI